MNTLPTEVRKEIIATLKSHIANYGATAFASPCSLIRERGEDSAGRTDWAWAIEYGNDVGTGTPLELTEANILARMQEWSENECLEWGALTQPERNMLIIQMYEESYIDEVLDKITADWFATDY